MKKVANFFAALWTLFWGKPEVNEAKARETIGGKSERSFTMLPNLLRTTGKSGVITIVCSLGKASTEVVLGVIQEPIIFGSRRVALCDIDNGEMTFIE